MILMSNIGGMVFYAGFERELIDRLHKEICFDGSQDEVRDVYTGKLKSIWFPKKANFSDKTNARVIHSYRKLGKGSKSSQQNDEFFIAQQGESTGIVLSKVLEQMKSTEELSALIATKTNIAVLRSNDLTIYRGGDDIFYHSTDQYFIFSTTKKLISSLTEDAPKKFDVNHGIIISTKRSMSPVELNFFEVEHDKTNDFSRVNG